MQELLSPQHPTPASRVHSEAVLESLHGVIPDRVLIINADCYRKPRILDLLGLRNDHVIVCGHLGSMHRWGHYQHPEATMECVVAPAGASTTETTLVFHAGALLAERPELASVPWLIITQDGSLTALTACLRHRKVRSLGMLPLFESDLRSVEAYDQRLIHEGDATGRGVKQAARAGAPHRASELGQELHLLIQASGSSYPVSSNRVKRLIESQPDRLSQLFRETLAHLKQGGRTSTGAIRKLAQMNGFVVSTTKILAFNG